MGVTVAVRLNTPLGTGGGGGRVAIERVVDFDYHIRHRHQGEVLVHVDACDHADQVLAGLEVRDDAVQHVGADGQLSGVVPVDVRDEIDSRHSRVRRHHSPDDRGVVVGAVGHCAGDHRAAYAVSAVFAVIAASYQEADGDDPDAEREMPPG
jgi:hypothetical protein